MTLGAIMATVMFVFFCVRDTGFSWMTTWWLWLFVVLSPLPFLFVGRAIRISAGADWLRYGKTGFVSTYELTTAKITTGGASRYLELTDEHGNSAYAPLHNLQMNRELWDLVYNGILHSVRGNGAETNKLARTFLDLDNPLRFRGE
ncbi:hypothetical protein J2S53_004142 [Actinopolyspora lacussalsi]|nr:hypothetical protein [Actinopolyspora lacussalsi]